MTNQTRNSGVVTFTEVVVDNFFNVGILNLLTTKRRGSDDSGSTSKTHQQSSTNQTQNIIRKKQLLKIKSQYPDFGNC